MYQFYVSITSSVLFLGIESSYFSWEICHWLHLVCWRYSESYKNSRRLCVRRSLVPSHSDCHKQRWCSRICSQNSIWGTCFLALSVTQVIEDFDVYISQMFLQALQAPACHENMVKVGGYILGEFGNLIAGDQRSSPLVQFQLLHSKVITRCLYSLWVEVQFDSFHVLYITFSFFAVSSLFSHDQSSLVIDICEICQSVPWN